MQFAFFLASRLWGDLSPRAETRWAKILLFCASPFPLGKVVATPAFITAMTAGLGAIDQVVYN